MDDFLISYTQSDRDWAWLAAELKELGHRPHIHRWEIAGGDIYVWIEAHLDTVDHVLCIVLDEYLKAPYSTLERKPCCGRRQAPGSTLCTTGSRKLASRIRLSAATP
jgi:hypothetical protein